MVITLGSRPSAQCEATDVAVWILKTEKDPAPRQPRRRSFRFSRFCRGTCQPCAGGRVGEYRRAAQGSDPAIPVIVGAGVRVDKPPLVTVEIKGLGLAASEVDASTEYAGQRLHLPAVLDLRAAGFEMTIGKCEREAQAGRAGARFVALEECLCLRVVDPAQSPLFTAGGSLFAWVPPVNFRGSTKRLNLCDRERCKARSGGLRIRIRRRCVWAAGD